MKSIIFNFDEVSEQDSGEMEEEMPPIVENVLEDFIFERFKNYIESGKHLTKKIISLSSLISLTS